MIECQICGNEVSERDVIEIEDEDRYMRAVHIECYHRAETVLSVNSMRKEISALNTRLNDATILIHEQIKRLENSADVSGFMKYLENFRDEQEIAKTRAARGSVVQIASAFRMNDASDLIERLRLLLPKKDLRSEVS